VIKDLKPYPAYKDSGVPWLGSVPDHWEVKRAKNILKSVDIRSVTGEEELLTVSSKRGVVPRRVALVTMFKAESYIGHKLCWPNDLVINSLWAWARGLGVSRNYGIVSTAYGVYRLRTGADVDSMFIHELVRSAPFHWELQVRSKGVWTSRLQLTDDSFLGAPLPVPPLPEQSAIVRFLDHVDRRIRRYILAKQKLIKLLEEQKQAIIHRAVTRGLDPNVRLKPSGVEWLGDVPEHWEVIALKRLAKIIDGDRGLEYPNANDFIQNGIPFLSSKSIVNGQLVLKNVPFISTKKFSRLGQGKLLKNDLVITVRGTIGNCALFTGAPYPTAFINAQMMIVRPDCEKISPEYLLYLATSRYWQDQLSLRAYGSAQQQLSNQILSSQPLPAPPLKEQQVILTSLHPGIATIDRSITQAQSEIYLIREYRIRMIADVVTGKLDVREAAANLPDEVEKPDQFEDVDAIAEDYEEGDDASPDATSEEAEA
jgi:type I restriction enzyme S subunit